MYSYRNLLVPVCVVFAATASAALSDSVAPLQLNEVVVTGSNAATSRNLMPYTVSIVDHRQLESAPGSDLLSAISGEIPSLFVTQRGILGFGVSNGGSGHIKMRGVGGDRASAVLMMVDGQPQFAGLYSHHVADIYNKEYVERVEVLRGPASVLYGSNAMAGVINVITRGAQPDDGVRATLTSQYGSYNTWLSSLTATARYGNFTALVSGSFDRTDGNVDNFDFREASGYGKIGYAFSKNWNAVADYTIANFHGKDPIYPTLDNPESTDIYRQNVTRGEASLAVSNSYGTTGGTIRVYYSYGNHFIDDPRHFHSTDDRLGVIAYQNIRPWSSADVTVGFDFDRYTGEIPVSGGRPQGPDNLGTISRRHIAEYSPYLTVSQGLLDRILIVNAGLRVACSDMFDTQVIPQGGIVVNPGAGFTIKGSVAMGYRNPSFRELYLYRMANPDLEPERMMNYEVSVHRDMSRWLRADVTFYYSKGNNMIQTVDMKNQNTGRFINKGIEVSLSSRPLDNLSLRAAYSYLYTSLKDLTGAPRHQYFIGADWRVCRSLTLNGALKGVGHLYVHPTVATQSYATLDVKATVAVLKYLDLFISLDNITDARYMINRGYPMPGFTAMGGFKLKL